VDKVGNGNGQNTAAVACGQKQMYAKPI